MNEITDEKLKKYFDLTGRALKKVKIKVPDNVNLRKVAEDFVDMAERYYKDAKYFEEKGDIVNAFAAVTYAHAFLDAGARLGVFDVKDNKLFMVD